MMSKYVLQMFTRPNVHTEKDNWDEMITEMDNYNKINNNYNRQVPFLRLSWRHMGLYCKENVWISNSFQINIPTWLNGMQHQPIIFWDGQSDFRGGPSITCANLDQTEVTFKKWSRLNINVLSLYQNHNELIRHILSIRCVRNLISYKI